MLNLKLALDKMRFTEYGLQMTQVKTNHLTSCIVELIVLSLVPATAKAARYCFDLADLALNFM